ncbi:MAG TPA: hypothetical protein VF725_00095 [Ktedonobacterales bacterium]
MPQVYDELPKADPASLPGRMRHNTSDLFLQTVAMLRALAEEQGEGAVEMAFAAVVADNRHADYGKATQAYERGYDDDHPFWTMKDLITDPFKREEFNARRVQRELMPDHGSYWTTEDDQPGACVSQPYGLSWESLCTMVDLCREFGLQMMIEESYSWPAPGKSLLVEVRRKREPAPRIFRML